MARRDTRSLVIRLLNAKYSLPTWMWLIFSTITSGIFLFLLINPAPTPELDQFLAAMPMDVIVWSSGLVISGIITIIGMAKDWAKWIAVGSFSSFVLWSFGFFTFTLLAKATTIVILVLPYMMFFAYTFLASIFRDKMNL